MTQKEFALMYFRELAPIVADWINDLGAGWGEDTVSAEDLNLFTLKEGVDKDKPVLLKRWQAVWPSIYYALLEGGYYPFYIPGRGWGAGNPRLAAETAKRRIGEIATRAISANNIIKHLLLNAPGDIRLLILKVCNEGTQHTRTEEDLLNGPEKAYIEQIGLPWEDEITPILPQSTGFRPDQLIDDNTEEDD